MWENHHKLKMLEHAELVDKCKDNGWKSWCFRLSFRLESAENARRDKKERRILIFKAGRTAESASIWIWNWKRHNDPNYDTNDPYAQPQPNPFDAQPRYMTVTHIQLLKSHAQDKDTDRSET